MKSNQCSNHRDPIRFKLAELNLSGGKKFYMAEFEGKLAYQQIRGSGTDATDWLLFENIKMRYRMDGVLHQERYSHLWIKNLDIVNGSITSSNLEAYKGKIYHFVGKTYRYKRKNRSEDYSVREVVFWDFPHVSQFASEAFFTPFETLKIVNPGTQRCDSFQSGLIQTVWDAMMDTNQSVLESRGKYVPGLAKREFMKNSENMFLLSRLIPNESHIGIFRETSPEDDFGSHCVLFYDTDSRFLPDSWLQRGDGLKRIGKKDIKSVQDAQDVMWRLGTQAVPHVSEQAWHWCPPTWKQVKNSDPKSLQVGYHTRRGKIPLLSSEQVMNIWMKQNSWKTCEEFVLSKMVRGKDPSGQIII